MGRARRRPPPTIPAASVITRPIATIEIQVTSEWNEGDVCVFFFPTTILSQSLLERSGSELNELEGCTSVSSSIGIASMNSIYHSGQDRQRQEVKREYNTKRKKER